MSEQDEMATGGAWTCYVDDTLMPDLGEVRSTTIRRAQPVTAPVEWWMLDVHPDGTVTGEPIAARAASAYARRMLGLSDG